MNEKVLEEIRREAHATHAPEYKVGKDLYRLVLRGEVVGYVSAFERSRVLQRYRANGGKQDLAKLLVERVESNVQRDVAEIYS